jgi:hypothetical protein
VLLGIVIFYFQGARRARAKGWFKVTKDNLDQEVDSGSLPGAFELSGEMQMPARIIPGKGNSALTASGIIISNPDLKGLDHVDTSAITQVLVEQAVDVVHETGGVPVTVVAIAGLPGGVLRSG